MCNTRGTSHCVAIAHVTGGYFLLFKKRLTSRCAKTDLSPKAMWRDEMAATCFNSRHCSMLVYQQLEVEGTMWGSVSLSTH